MAKRVKQAVIIAPLKTEEDRKRAMKTRTMLAASGFDRSRVIDVGRLHVGFGVLDNDDVIETCFSLAPANHPNMKYVNGEPNFLSPADIDKAGGVPAIEMGDYKAQEGAVDTELDALRQRYTVVTGQVPDKRFKADRLKKEIEAAESGQVEISL